MIWIPFVKSGFGQMEYKLCEKFHKTPMELGELRNKDPLGVSFLERSIINEYQEKIDVQDELQAKVKVYEQRRDSVRQTFQLEINEAELKSRKMSQANLQKLSQELQQKDHSVVE